MRRRYLVVSLLLLFAMAAVAMAGCGRTESVFTSTTVGAGEEEGATTTLPPSANPIKIVFNGEITGDLVYDAASVDRGIHTALQMIGNRIGEWSVEYQEVDNQADPLLAVDQTRDLVQMDTDDDGKDDRDPVDLICGPLSSSDAAAVSYFLSQRAEERERVPQVSVTGQPRENITTSGGLGFIPSGIYSSYGYYLGKFASEIMHYQTANCIHYMDRIAEDIQSGFERGFTAGGGTISSVTYVHTTTVDFSYYFAQMVPADCTMFWVRGSGAVPFVQQYETSGLTGQLLVAQSSNYTDSQLAYLEALGAGEDMIGCDIYTSVLSNSLNTQFVDTFRQLYPAEDLTVEVFGGWQAVMLYANAVESLSALQEEGIRNEDGELYDARNPAHVVAMMSSLTMDTPSGSITIGRYGKTYVATRDFYILRSDDVGGGHIAWSPIYTYSQVRMAE